MVDPIFGMKFSRKAKTPQSIGKSTPIIAKEIATHIPVARLVNVFVTVYLTSLFIISSPLSRDSGLITFIFFAISVDSISMKITTNKIRTELLNKFPTPLNTSPVKDIILAGLICSSRPKSLSINPALIIQIFILDQYCENFSS